MARLSGQVLVIWQFDTIFYIYNCLCLCKHKVLISVVKVEETIRRQERYDMNSLEYGFYIAMSYIPKNYPGCLHTNTKQCLFYRVLLLQFYVYFATTFCA